MKPATEKRLKQVRNRLMKAVRTELQRGEISSTELLAVMAHTTGGCVAMQDQRTMTPEMAMQIVSKNLEAGNREAMAETLSAGGSPN